MGMRCGPGIRYDYFLADILRQCHAIAQVFTYTGWYMYILIMHILTLHLLSYIKLQFSMDLIKVFKSSQPE